MHAAGFEDGHARNRNRNDTMPNPVRIGVIGTSLFTDFMHLTNLRSHPQARLSAICGRSHARAAELAAKHDIPLVFTDYREMIAKGSLDAVVVAVPDDLHFPMVMEALDAGLHVLCEKPLASDAAQARAMVEKAEAAGVKHMVYFTWPWLSHYQQMQRLIADGYIGQPRHCAVSYLSDYGAGRADAYQYNWRWDNRRSNGVLGDLGSHAIQFARLCVGEIARVCARLDAFVERTDADGEPIPRANDAAALAIEFANGSHGVIQLSAVTHMADHFMDQRITLIGDAGTLESALTFASKSLRGARRDASVFEDFGSVVFGPDEDIFEVFRTESVGDRLFIDAILQDKPVSPDFYDGLRVQQVLDAAVLSHREARWAAVAES
jgi:predicted dehydrogenase